jgi:hypothetical protein
LGDQAFGILGEGERTQGGMAEIVSSRENIVGHGQSYFADWQMAFPAIRYVGQSDRSHAGEQSARFREEKPAGL